MVDDDPIERWLATTPEPKLELIDGRLVISTLAGSRRIIWMLLQDYGPALALPYASPDMLEGKMVLSGDEGTRRVMAMLLMTLGLRDVVKLAHPKEWVRCLSQQTPPTPRRPSGRHCPEARKSMTPILRPGAIHQCGRVAR